jgi:hypothetical protein
MSSQKTDFLSLLKENSKKTPFPAVYKGSLKLKRSVIDNADRVVFHLDPDSNLQIASKALSLGLTVDELYRQLAWTYLTL